jgi:hypothetical protein
VLSELWFQAGRRTGVFVPTRSVVGVYSSAVLESLCSSLHVVVRRDALGRPIQAAVTPLGEEFVGDTGPPA